MHVNNISHPMSSAFTYSQPSSAPELVVREEQVEYGFIGKLQGLKYEYRPDIRDRAALERNFREKFEALNRVKLSDGEFARLLDEIVTPDVFTAAKTIRTINSFTREDGTPLNYTLVNIKDWCKNTFEVVNQLRINTDYSRWRCRCQAIAARPAVITGHWTRKPPPATSTPIARCGIAMTRAKQKRWNHEP